MGMLSNSVGPVALAFLVGLVPGGCSPRSPGADESGAAPADTAARSDTAVQTDTTTMQTDSAPPADPAPADTAAAPSGRMPVPGPDTSVATPPINPQPPETSPDISPAEAPEPGNQERAGGSLQVSPVEYEGWRQYSVQCARCHGQDVLGNPVAANLLTSLGPGGPIDTPEKFIQVVSEGRPERGMPAFKGIMTPEQIRAVNAYVKGRAEKRIPAGRPTSS